jgi:glycosyltransferase involved in cell wall biosynthesis
MKRSTGKRVLMLLENDYYPRDNRVYLEAQALREAGLAVTVICPGNRSQTWRELHEGVLVYRFRSDLNAQGALGYLWEYAWSLTAVSILSLLVLMRHGFDVIHAHNPPDLFVLLALLYKPLGKQFVFDHHDLAPELFMARFQCSRPGLAFRLLVFFERLSCRAADHVIATNGSYKRVQMERSGIPAARITIVRNGPDLHRIRRVEAAAWLRERAPIIIGYLGLMGVQDGVDHLLRAIHCLVHELRRDGVFCVLIGSGDALPSLRQLCRELDLQRHVHFTGYLSGEELLRHLSAADIFVDPEPACPYNDRCTTIKIMEYMALARPIVAYDLTEHRVSAGDAAVYAQENHPRGLAQCIAQLMDDAPKRRRMGQCGRQRIETQLNWDWQRGQLLEAYAKLGLLAVADATNGDEIARSATRTHDEQRSATALQPQEVM